MYPVQWRTIKSSTRISGNFPTCSLILRKKKYVFRRFMFLWQCSIKYLGPALFTNMLNFETIIVKFIYRSIIYKYKYIFIINIFARFCGLQNCHYLT